MSPLKRTLPSRSGFQAKEATGNAVEKNAQPQPFGNRQPAPAAHNNNTPANAKPISEPAPPPAPTLEAPDINAQLAAIQAQVQAARAGEKLPTALTPPAPEAKPEAPQVEKPRPAPKTEVQKQPQAEASARNEDPKPFVPKDIPEDPLVAEQQLTPKAPQQPVPAPEKPLAPETVAAKPVQPDPKPQSRPEPLPAEVPVATAPTPPAPIKTPEPLPSEAPAITTPETPSVLEMPIIQTNDTPQPVQAGAGDFYGDAILAPNTPVDTQAPQPPQFAEASAMPTMPETAETPDRVPAPVNMASDDSSAAAPELPKDTLPELPSAHANKGRQGFSLGTLMGLVVLVLICGAGYWLVTNSGQGRERYSELQQEPRAVQTSAEEVFQPFGVVNGAAPLPAQPRDETALMGTPVAPATGENNNVLVEFLEVTDDEASQPITPDDPDQMPEDVSAFARLQAAIDQQRAQRDGAPAGDAGNVSAEVADAAELYRQSQQELAAYRKALANANNREELQSPGQFKNDFDPNKFPEVPTVALQPQGVAENVLLPPEEVYLENPYNLPVVEKPSYQAPVQAVRTLEDFEMAMVKAPEDRVRIPSGIRPKLSSQEFPPMEVLSFIPNRGLIATTKGREGVLLVGEELEGWQLVSVYDTYAEFRNGERQHIVENPY